MLKDSPPLKFTKMQALGNDFVVVDGIRQAVALEPRLAARIADRHAGIGCDQILVAEQALADGADFRMRIFNADGGEVGQCGNGARCFGRFLLDNELTRRREIVVETMTGLLTLYIDDSGEVRVDMGVPRFEPPGVPFLADAEQAQYDLEVDGCRVRIAVLAVGNPHAVLFVDDVAQAPVAVLGPQIESHARFPDRTNVGFAQVVDRGSIRLRVYERGAGETRACGSGACAAVVAGRRLGLLDPTVAVALPGGRLGVSWQGDDSPVLLSGPAKTVFEGRVDLSQL